MSDRKDCNVLKWSQDIEANDKYGTSIKAYDDVEILEPVDLKDTVRSDSKIADRGSIGTILFISENIEHMLDLEFCLDSEGLGFGCIEAKSVRLHKTTQEKWPENYA